MQSRRKVLFLPKWYPCEGDVQHGVFVQKHARAAALHNEVAVLHAHPSKIKSRIAKSTEGSLTEVIIYYKVTAFSAVNFSLYVISMFRGWHIIAKSGFMPDVCHVHIMTRPILVALWLRLRHAIPFIISEHWSGYLTGLFERQSFFKKWFMRWAMSKASLITAVSDHLKNAMLQCRLKGSYRILPNIVETMPDAWRQQPAAGTFRFLVVADLKDTVKNISGVIRAFGEVHRKDEQTELMIVGDGIDRDVLEKQAKPGVTFLGEKTNQEVLRIIPAAHVLIVNSRIETFSVVTLEAIFSGRPVIATRCGGPQQFINEQNGMLIEKDNAAELASAMIRIKNNYSRYVPEKIKDSLPRLYTMDAVARQLDNCYEEVSRQR